MTDDDFLAAFETATFARPEWTHEAHVRMARLYLLRFPFADALEKVRGGIRKLNAALGGPPDAYHDTITVAFVRIIADRLDAGEPYDAFRDRNPDLFDRTLPAVLRFYTKEHLYTAEARRAFVEPDREPLPR
jgi:hypothetical protein